MVCTDNNCPVHVHAQPAAGRRPGTRPRTHHGTRPEQETDEEAEERKRQYEQQQSAYREMQERRVEERRRAEERREQEYEAEQARREELRQTRKAAFERIFANAPETFSAAQLRMLLRALVNLDPYTFADDVAEEIAREDENESRTAEEVLLATIDATADEKLTRFALRLALSGHAGIPRENEPDFLTEAETVFAPPPKKAKAQKSKHAPVAVAKASPKKKTAKKQIAA